MRHHIIFRREKPALDCCSAARSRRLVGSGSGRGGFGNEHVGGEVEVEDFDGAAPDIEHAVCPGFVSS
jgi:hypothetical protein